MSNHYAPPQDVPTYSVSQERQPPTSAPVDVRTIHWLIQQRSEKQAPNLTSPGIMIHSSPSSQDNILGNGDDYTFIQESADDHESWPTMAPQMYSPAALQIHFNAPHPLYPETDWNTYPSYGPLNEANLSPTAFMNYSPNGNNSLSPFSMQARTPLSIPQLSPASSDHSLSPSLYTPCLSTPTTPGSTSQSFLPSPTVSQQDHMQQQESLFSNADPDRPRGYTHREQQQLFREALSLHREGAGPFIPQLMYKPHTTSDRKRYVEDVRLEGPIYFVVEHPDQCGIPLIDALHSRVKNLANREHVVFEGRGPSVSIRLEWPGYRQWSRQIPTKDFRSPPGPITVAKLAKNVAKCVQRFIQDRKPLSMEEGFDVRWRIGDRPNDIKLEDLMLVSIHHVSLGSWQPHLRLRRPQSNIPIQSSAIGSSAVNNILFSF